MVQVNSLPQRKDPKPQNYIIVLKSSCLLTAEPHWTSPFEWLKTVLSVCAESVVSRQPQDDVRYLVTLVSGWGHSRQ